MSAIDVLAAKGSTPMATSSTANSSAMSSDFRPRSPVSVWAGATLGGAFPDSRAAMSRTAASTSRSTSSGRMLGPLPFGLHHEARARPRHDQELAQPRGPEEHVVLVEDLD